jgi:hypothetical protein
VIVDLEPDETNNARATDEPVPIPKSLIILSISNETLASSGSGTETEVVYLQVGQMHTFQMPDPYYIDKIRLDDAGIMSLTHWFEHDNLLMTPIGRRI